MNKEDVKLCKKKILKCLTEDFDYGKLRPTHRSGEDWNDYGTRKDGQPLKKRKQNQAIFAGKKGFAVFNDTDLEMVMDKVVLGLYFSLEDSE